MKTAEKQRTLETAERNQTMKKKDRIVALRKNGRSYNEIADEVKCSIPYVYAELRKAGLVNRHPSHARPRSTESLARELVQADELNERLIRRIDELTEELGAIHREGFLGKLARLLNIK